MLHEPELLDKILHICVTDAETTLTRSETLPFLQEKRGRERFDSFLVPSLEIPTRRNAACFERLVIKY